jgi:hypothetical protein
VAAGNSFELEGYAGLYHFDSSVEEKAQLEADNNPVFGLRFGSGARNIFSGETTLGYAPMNDIRIFLLMGNFLVNIPVDLVIPYLTLGTGTTIYLPRDIQNEAKAILNTETKFTLNYGGGFRYFMNDLLALRVDFRDYVTFNLDFEVDNPDELEEPQDIIDVGTVHNTVVALGLSLVF